MNDEFILSMSVIIRLCRQKRRVESKQPWPNDSEKDILTKKHLIRIDD